MIRTARFRSFAAIVFAYALALQGMFSPLAAAVAGVPGAHADICYGLPDDGNPPASRTPGGADLCNLGCCASMPVAAPPTGSPHATPLFSARALERPATAQTALGADRRRTVFPRAPPAV